ncbi:MAG: NAD(P)/FAD-dependent oxidoreductase [Lachnospiraceae bacterium]|nr:NAD(P)/FAD-dependent oxidoreductase [Lachnospiraceae bacterium]
MQKVIIIGGGPAGLTAATELLKSNEEFEITILEESSTFGGISRTVKTSRNRMDIGGHRFFSKDDRVMKWWFDLMPLQGSPSFDDIKLNREKELSTDGPDPNKEDIVMLKRQRVSRIYYKKKFFDYPVSLKWDTIKNMGFITTIEAGFSYLFSVVNRLPETSLENFYINRFGKKLYSMFFEGYTEKLWGRHPREISADWGAQRVKGLSIIAVIKDVISKILPNNKNREVETSLIEEFYYPKYGPGQLWETVAKNAENNGAHIITNAKVTNLYTNGENSNSINRIEYVKDGKTFELEADIVLSSMPLKDLVNGMNDSTSTVKEIANGLPYRDFVTVGLELNKLNLKNKTSIPTLGNIVPDCWIYVQDTHVKLGRIQIFNNWSPYMVEDPENHVWIGLEYFCDEGDEFWNMTAKETVKKAVRELYSMGIIDKTTKITKAHRERVKKAYPAYFDTYSEIDTLISWLDTHDNLYCIGRNGQHRYNNMDHSMATAFEAVDNILSNKKDKSNIWSVNTEKSYHEKKTK